MPCQGKDLSSQTVCYLLLLLFHSYSARSFEFSLSYFEASKKNKPLKHALYHQVRAEPVTNGMPKENTVSEWHEMIRATPSSTSSFIS